MDVTFKFHPLFWLFLQYLKKYFVLEKKNKGTYWTSERRLWLGLALHQGRLTLSIMNNIENLVDFIKILDEMHWPDSCISSVFICEYNKCKT